MPDDAPIASSAASRTGGPSRSGPAKDLSQSGPFPFPAICLVVFHSAFGCNGTIDAGRDIQALAPEPSEIVPGGALRDASPGEPTQAVEAGSPPDEPSDVPDGGSETGDPDGGSETCNPDGGSETCDPDGGSETPAALLPVDAVNPIVIVNDYAIDNWFGEYALLMASSGRIDLAGIVVNTSGYWPDLAVNQTRWQELIDASRASGLQNVPDLVADDSPALVVPADENVDATMPNDSLGARFIVETANALGTPELPLVVVNGGSLTDVADAYLIDPTVAERVVVVASVGQSSTDGAFTGGPNGELDRWASTIVAQRLPFVQVSAYYEQGEDVPDARAAELPANAFGDWMRSKVTETKNAFAADQTALLAVVLPGFATDASRVGYAGSNAQGSPLLTFQEDGCCWLVGTSDGTLAGELLWEMLDEPNTFEQ